MTTLSKTTPSAHPVIWRELHAPDVEAAKAFYHKLLGWRFQAEQAESFAWGAGPGAYHLIEAGEEIHGGMAQCEPEGEDGGEDADVVARWLCYVRVPDVADAVKQAEALDATVQREPFEVPGVGVNAVIADPAGAQVGLSTPSYSYPYPASVFAGDRLFTDDPAGADGFYEDLFGWTFSDEGAVGASGKMKAGAPSFWAPVLGVSKPNDVLKRATELGGVVQRANGPVTITDPQGAVFVVETRL